MRFFKYGIETKSYYFEFFCKDLWDSRNEWWEGTKKMGGVGVCWTNIFPWLFWFRHPVSAWR